MEYLMKCAAIALIIIAIAWVFRKFINNISNGPVNVMYQEYADLMKRIQNAETYAEVVELEKDIDQFDYKYQANEDCAGFVKELFFERQEKKHAFYHAMAGKESFITL